MIKIKGVSLCDYLIERMKHRRRIPVPKDKVTYYTDVVGRGRDHVPSVSVVPTVSLLTCRSVLSYRHRPVLKV